MKNTQVLQQILPKTPNIKRLSILVTLEAEFSNNHNVEPDPILRLASLLDTNKTDCLGVAERLKLSRTQRKRISYLVNPEKNFDPDLSESDVKQVIRHLGSDRACDLAFLSWASELCKTANLPQLRTKAYSHIITQCKEWSLPKFELSGTDVLNLGVQPGPEVGKLLKQVESWWEDNGYRASRADCINELERILLKIKEPKVAGTERQA